MEIGENWAPPGTGRLTGGEGVWDILEGVKLELSYCVNRHYTYAMHGEYAGQRAKKVQEWYRSEQGVGAVNTKCLADG